MSKSTKKKAASEHTTVLLVRHGQNDWVGKNKLAGHTPDVHLNKLGRKQARSVGKRLLNEAVRIDAIYASPLERTMETARLIAGYLDLPVNAREAIGEVDCGDWTGKSLQKLAKHPHWPIIQFYPSKARFPNGESIFEMQTRTVKEIDRLAAEHPGQTLLLVSHADVIKCAAAHYLGMHLDLFQRIVISPASISAIVFTPMRPMIYTLNDTSHLPLEKVPIPST